MLAPAGRFLKENALTIVFGLLFAGSLMGQIVTGHAVHDDEAIAHGGRAMSLLEYLCSGHFIEAVFENWESEFLQMALFVVLTKYLKQKGSSESKKLDGREEVDEDPRAHRADEDAPGPVKQGDVVLSLYERSLSLSLLALFLASFALHAAGGVKAHNEDERRHGRPSVSTLAYLKSSQLWFESFQNWQSEFLSVAALVVLSIYLRERGSPQSKPVAAPHGQTGE